LDPRIGEVYLSAEELAARVRELGAEIARDYAGREPVLVGSLKASLVFLADLSRAMPIVHGLDFVELAGYGSAQMGGHEQIRVLKDLDLDILDRDVIVVEDVVDTGLTLNYLVRTFELRRPRTIGPTAGSWTTSPSATSASSCPTSSSWATASTSRSGGASCPTSGSCAWLVRALPGTDPVTTP
jgi:hypoxanthine phosphoribosyltransferase